MFLNYHIGQPPSGLNENPTDVRENPKMDCPRHVTMSGIFLCPAVIGTVTIQYLHCLRLLRPGALFLATSGVVEYEGRGIS